MTSKKSGFVEGKPLPYKFKKRSQGRWFNLGGHRIADLRKSDKGWLVIVQGEMPHYLIPRMVEGFKTRQDAIDYSLKVHQLTYKTYNRDAIEMKKLTKVERNQLKLKYNCKCAYCGEALGDRWHVDHIEAVHRNPHGGCDYPEKDILENFNPSCVSCNLSKKVYSLDEWREQLKYHVTALNNNSTTYRLAKKYGLISETEAEVVFYFETIERSV